MDGLGWNVPTLAMASDTAWEPLLTDYRPLAMSDVWSLSLVHAGHGDLGNLDGVGDYLGNYLDHLGNLGGLSTFAPPGLFLRQPRTPADWSRLLDPGPDHGCVGRRSVCPLFCLRLVDDLGDAV
jgi:hypothetical protein